MTPSSLVHVEYGHSINFEKSNYFVPKSADVCIWRLQHFLVHLSARRITPCLHWINPPWLWTLLWIVPNLISASGYISKNDCKWNSNPCLHQPETYSSNEVMAILKRRTTLTTRPSQLCVDSSILTYKNVNLFDHHLHHLCWHFCMF